MAEKENIKHIIRVANVDLPGQKQLRYALTNIKGIGINFADIICKIAKLDKNIKAGALSDSEVINLNKIITEPSKHGIPNWIFNHRREFETNEDKHLITGTLNFVQDNDVKRLKKIKCYVGIRHIQGQPVRGQRTRSNFRKGKGKVVGVAKKKAAPGKAADSGSKK